MHARTRHAVRTLVGGMAEPSSQDEHRVPLPRLSGRWRLLLGMVLANRPWLLVPGLKSALVAALATGPVATINSTMWLLAGSLSWWRLVVATIASIVLAVAWLEVATPPAHGAPEAPERPDTARCGERHPRRGAEPVGEDPEGHHTDERHAPRQLLPDPQQPPLVVVGAGRVDDQAVVPTAVLQGLPSSEPQRRQNRRAPPSTPQRCDGRSPGTRGGTATERRETVIGCTDVGSGHIGPHCLNA